MRITGLRPGRRRRPAGDEQYAADAFAGTPERPPARPRHAATQPRESSLLLSAPPGQAGAGAATVTVPVFRPHEARPGTGTAPVPVAAARPYVPDPLRPDTAVWPGARPVIGDSMTAPAGAPAMALRWLEQDEAAGREPTALPYYTQPGWAALQMSRWTASGEWEKLPAIVDKGLERNAAAMAVGLLRNRATIRDGVLQGCADMEMLDLGRQLLRQVQQLVNAARAVPATGGAA